MGNDLDTSLKKIWPYRLAAGREASLNSDSLYLRTFDFQSKNWSSNLYGATLNLYCAVEKLVSQWAHNPKIAGSSPACATKNENMLTKSDIEKAIELGKKFPNNQDLGKNARSEIKDDFLKSRPNDFDLGNSLRKIILDISKKD